MKPTALSILGAGCTGPLLSVLLARRGYDVALFERRSDPRVATADQGRSINLALAARGLAGLQRAGLLDDVWPSLIPMRGRMVHAPDGSQQLLPYGQGDHEVIYSVGRAALNRLLVAAAVRHGVEVRFQHRCTQADFNTQRCTVRDELRGRDFELPMQPLIAADGAGSHLRDAMVATGRVAVREDVLAHGYKELDIPAIAGRHALTREALHIWPRGGYMLIALPNTDGSFTATLFMAASGEFPSFTTLDSAAAVQRLFTEQFADLLPLIPTLTEQFLANPTGTMATVHAAPWHIDGQALLIGDAAHAIVPFHGQGMNAGFEDCVLFDELLGRSADWNALFTAFEAQRRPNTNAIAELALENYIEMRDTVRDPKFQLQKSVALELERRLPEHFIPQYSMVMFHAEIPYAIAQSRGRIQAALLQELTRDCERLEDVDLAAAERLVRERLAPLPQSLQPLRTRVTNA